ncbi:MAG: EAL domain-containing protein, partial [Nitrospiria bacterium]
WHLDTPEQFESFRRVTEALSLEPGKGLPGRVLASRQPAWVRDVTVDDNFPRANPARVCGIRAGFAFPVWVGKEVVAVLEFFSTEISDPDPAFLTVMANIGTQLGRVVERKRTEERLSYIANYDPLTGLPNRGLCLDRLKDELVRSRWQERFVAVLFLDLDRFKNVNDTLGHSLGDRLLKAVADRLTACVRAGDTVARLGGDEFVVILRDMARPEDAVPVAQKILDGLARPFVVAEVELFLTTSIGISQAPADGTDPETLLKNADTAMYRAKDLGKNTFQLYTTDMNFRVFENMELETNLRRALERHEFELHYQPVVDLRSRRLVGAEALVRWRQPDGTLMPPAKFIPVAEETGLIVPLGEWVLRTACEQSKAWRANGSPGIRVAVNLSARQFHRRGLLTEQVARALAETGLEVDGLGLELTESVLMQTGDSTIDALKALHAMGIPIALDDFGTGYSSLSYLKRFPIATVKIDRSFVHDITTDADDAAIVTAIITMAHSLKLKVVAEGVETAEQLARLKLLGCDQVQGYLLSRPLPAGEMAAWLVDGPVGGPWLNAVGS